MSQPHTIVPTDDNGLVLAGTSLAGDASRVVARLDQDGRPDEGFASGGIVDVGFPGLDVPVGLGALGDGRILVGGTLGTELAFGAARLTAAGCADARFGNDGIGVIPVSERAVSSAGALAPGGAFVLAGPAVLPGPLKKLAVTRLQGDPPPVPPVDDPPAGGPGTGDPQPQPVADEQPPAVTGLRVSRRVAGARPRIRFTLSEAAHVTVTLKRRHGRSTRVERDAVAGANRLRGARRLVRGRHRLTVVAVDPAGNAAPPARVRFKVTAR